MVENLSRTQIVQYAARPATTIRCTRTTCIRAKAAGYPSVFAHGMLTMGLTGKMLTNYVGDGRLTKFGVRFTNQVWPGDTWMPTRRWRRSARKGDNTTSI